MYYLAKIAQAAGLTLILIDFLKNFPNLMNRKILMAGIILFGFGWIVERFMLKRRQ